MLDPRKTIGNRGEDLAAIFLETKGFHLLTRNWRCRFGEIDLIVERNGEVRFVEVKTRATMTYGNPEEALTRTKLNHFRLAILSWLNRQSRPPARYQADAVTILIKKETSPEIRWIEAIL